MSLNNGACQGAGILSNDEIVEPPPVKAHERREKLLLEAHESGQISVREQIGAVLMIFRVRDVEADLVQARGPLQ